MYDDFREDATRNYRKIFPVSLALNERNLKLAYNVVSLGVEEGYPLYRAVTEYITFRYRRLENFIQETGMYSVKERGWRVQVALLKVRGVYNTARERLTFDFEITVHKPYHLDTVDNSICNFIFYECLGFTPFMLTPAELEKWEYDIMGSEIQGYRSYMDECKATMGVYSTRGYEYEYGFNVTVSKYHVWGTGKAGQPPYVEVTLLYERPL